MLVQQCHPECWKQGLILLHFLHSHLPPSLTYEICIGIKQKHILRLLKCYSRFRWLSYISISNSGQAKTSINFKVISIAQKSLPFTFWRPDYRKHTRRIAFRMQPNLLSVALYITVSFNTHAWSTALLHTSVINQV